MDMTQQRWQRTLQYTREVFGKQDAHMAALMSNAVQNGLPDIAVSADVGRLLMMLTSMTRAQLAIEIGTLGGYSGIWLARGLHPNGRLITIDIEQKHADFAAEQFTRAGVADRVEQRIGDAREVLRQLQQELQPTSVDVVFIDADKQAYPTYWEMSRSLIAPGGLLLVDNVLGSGNWWIDDTDHPDRAAVDELNRAVAADPEFEAVAVPLRQGVLIARRCAG